MDERIKSYTQQGYDIGIWRTKEGLYQIRTNDCKGGVVSVKYVSQYYIKVSTLFDKLTLLKGSE